MAKLNKFKLKKIQLKKIQFFTTLLAAIIFIFLIVSLIVLPHISCNRYVADGKFEMCTVSDFKKMLSHSSDYSTNHTEYLLKGNIKINVADLPEPKNFKGTLNGQGYSLTIIGEDETEFSRPIFDTIEESSKIERLDIKLESISLSAEKTSSNNIALLAGTNNGTISNCTITIPEIKIGKCPNAAGLVNSNYGNIYNVCMQIGSVKSNVDSVNWKSRFGAVATANFNLIKNIVLDISFDTNISTTDEWGVPSVLVGQTINQYIGYIKGSFVNSANTSEQNICIFSGDDFTYWSRAIDSNNSQYNTYDDIESFKKDKFKKIFDNSKNESQYWDYENHGFPKLKEGELKRIE